MLLWPRHHLGWVVGPYVLVRSLIAAKFLVAAALMGPTGFGAVAVALFVLAIVEAISDSGLAEAMIQQQEIPSARQTGQVWTFHVLRGLLLGSLLWTFSPVIASQFDPALTPLVRLGAIALFVRGFVGPSLIFARRERDFRAVAIVDSGAMVGDIAVTLSLLFSQFGPISVLAGLVAGDLLRLMASFRLQPRPSWVWPGKDLAGMVKYSKWISLASVTALLIAQSGRAVAGRLIGLTAVGIYDLSQRLGELAGRDVVSMAYHYGLAGLAEQRRVEPRLEPALFGRFLTTIGGAAVVGCTAAALIGPALLRLTLGSSWSEAARILPITTTTAAITALGTIFVIRLRAQGRSREAALPTLGELVSILAIAPWATSTQGLGGLARALLATSLVRLVWLAKLGWPGWTPILKAARLIFVVGFLMVLSATIGRITSVWVHILVVSLTAGTVIIWLLWHAREVLPSRRTGVNP